MTAVRDALRAEGGLLAGALRGEPAADGALGAAAATASGFPLSVPAW